MKNNNVYLWFGLLLIPFGLLFILTQPPWKDWFNFSGGVGDTINGIFSPFIAIIGAILVYISFKAQTEANRLQIERIDKEVKRSQQQSEFNLIFDLIKDFKQNFNDLKYHSGPRVYVEDIEAFQNILKLVGKKLETKELSNMESIYGYQDVLYLIITLIDINKKIKTSESNLSSTDRAVLYNSILRFYDIKMYRYISPLVLNIEKLKPVDLLLKSILLLNNEIGELKTKQLIDRLNMEKEDG